MRHLIKWITSKGMTFWSFIRIRKMRRLRRSATNMMQFKIILILILHSFYKQFQQNCQTESSDLVVMFQRKMDDNMEQRFISFEQKNELKRQNFIVSLIQFYQFVCWCITHFCPNETNWFCIRKWPTRITKWFVEKSKRHLRVKWGERLAHRNWLIMISLIFSWIQNEKLCKRYTFEKLKLIFGVHHSFYSALSISLVCRQKNGLWIHFR